MHGPIPLPVETRTIFLKRGAMARTPEAGVPRVQSEVGGLSIIRPVQSPARETMSENPFLPGAKMAAKECHSMSGRSVIRGAAEEDMRGVKCVKCKRTACREKGSAITGTRRRESQGEAMLRVVRRMR